MAAGAACNLLPGAGSAEVQLAMAAGAAFAGRARGSVAMSFCDDATMAANRGLLALAGRYDLPVLFVVEQARDGRRRRYRTEEHGFPTIPVDSRDVVAVYRVAQESIAKARLGSGPTLIECLPAPRRRVAARRQGTMRKPAQDQLQERLQDQLQDKIEAMEQYLAARGLLAAGARRAIEKEFSRELDQAARRARPSPRRAAR
jgi:pyruvate dehydrogenase E1 component alpha subunit